MGVTHVRSLRPWGHGMRHGTCILGGFRATALAFWVPGTHMGGTHVRLLQAERVHCLPEPPKQAPQTQPPGISKPYVAMYGTQKTM